jgi:UDP-GlcNAc:undecaprenyl-phosphate GlcNAc-1-phosphate transferase
MSLSLVPALRDFAHRREIVDTPEAHKRHKDPVPYLGGVAILAAFSIAVFVATYVSRYVDLSADGTRIEWLKFISESDRTFRELILVLVLALAFGVIGLIDDLRGLSPWLRLGVEALLTVCLIWFGVTVTTGLHPMFDYIITFVWVVGIMNAFNLLDNIDGLAAGTAFIASLTYFLIASFNGQEFSGLLTIGLAGCLLGFLRSNFNPASIYMGDAGSLFIGFLMAYFGLKMRTTVTEIPQLFTPILVLGVPILDTTIVVVSRWKRGVGPFTGGQDHLSHRFVRLGFSVRRSVTVLLVGSVALGLLAIALADARAGVGYWILGAAFVSGVAATITLTTKKALLTVVRDGVEVVAPQQRAIR